MLRSTLLASAALLAAAAPAWAGDVPVYAPPPAWVVPAPALPAVDDSSPLLLSYDIQQRLEDGTVQAYSETAMRLGAPEILTQAGTLSLPWIPDQGDLIIHRVELLRGSERIDLLAGTRPFTVIRRELQLEQQMQDGVLTATMNPQGLRLGDVLRVAHTVVRKDKALSGRVQTIAPVPTAPFRAGYARVRLSWPSADRIELRGYPDGFKPVDTVSNGYRTVEWTPPLPKPAELPDDVPLRFRKPPIAEATSFTGWADVSSTMATHYATDGLIAADGPIARETAKIVAAHADPLARAEAALELVQGHVRYLMLGMNGGGYTPQTPAITWERRYGDCKAKSLLLLAMLRQMGIEAEAVLASVNNGDAVPIRLPLPGVFDHVLVRATVGGRPYFLDGTRTGAQLADIGDVPDLRWVLPLRTAGAELMKVEVTPHARPDVAWTIDFDQRAGLDIPTLFRTEAKLRGAPGGMIKAVLPQLGPKEKRELIQGSLMEMLGGVQMSEGDIAADANGEVTIKAAGLMTTPWRRVDSRYQLKLDREVGGIGFEPDRSRAAWRALPAATAPASSGAITVIVRLPQEGRGFTLDGDPQLAVELAGAAISRTAALNGPVLSVREKVDHSGREIPADAIPAERAKVALAQTRRLTIKAPETMRRRWDSDAAISPDQVKAIEAVLAKAIAQDPEETAGYSTRASFRAGIYDRKGALADLTKLIALADSVDTRMRRARVHYELGDDAAALADAKAALALNPGSDEALAEQALGSARTGNHDAALTMIQERIDRGGSERFDAITRKAELLVRYGDKAEGLRLMDGALKEKPNDSTLLSSRCWLKAIAEIDLDSALKDCTRAISLAEDGSLALSNRAVVFLKQGRLEEARADIDAADDQDPGEASIHFIRAAIDAKAGTGDKGQTDLAVARRLDPRIVEEFGGYGVRL